MPKLYIASTQRQKHSFVARVPESSEFIRYDIAPGHQRIVYDGPLSVIEAIIKQQEPYGIKRSTEVARDKTFTGLAYQIDNPITVEQFIIADEINHEALTERGRETRENVANYAQASVLGVTRQAGDNLRSMSIEIEDKSPNPTFHEIYSPSRPRDVNVEDAPRRRGRSRK